MTSYNFIKSLIEKTKTHEIVWEGESDSKTKSIKQATLEGKNVIYIKSSNRFGDLTLSSITVISSANNIYIDYELDSNTELDDNLVTLIKELDDLIHPNKLAAELYTPKERYDFIDRKIIGFFDWCRSLSNK